LWNANGLIQHAKELKTFFSLHNIDVMLMSEAHFTEKSYLKLLNYTVYHTNHLAGTARGGTSIIIKILHTTSSIERLCFDFLQATTVSVEDPVGSLIISAVYLSPKQIVKQEQLETFYNTLGGSLPVTSEDLWFPLLRSNVAMETCSTRRCVVTDICRVLLM
jgi:hypothetical protein